MAEESEEVNRRIKEFLTQQADTTEEELRIRHGLAQKLDDHGKVMEGQYTVLETGARTRGKLEQTINSELERLRGKQEILQNRKQVLYEKELENYGYYINDQNILTKTISKQNIELDKEQKKVLDRLRKDGIQEEQAKTKKAEVQKAQDELGKNLGNGLLDLTKGLGSFAAGLTNGSTSFTSLNPLIDIVANTLGSLAKAIPFVGEAIAGLTKAAAEGAKLVLELMDKNLKAFQELGNAGALTAEGMEGVSRQFLESGLSLEGFKKAIKENAGDLAQWGKTVGGGADKFTKAVGMLTKSDGALADAGLGLRKLGMTSDDMGTAAAGFLQQELKLGRTRNMTEEQLAKGTVAYAQELDALQKITGLSKEELIKQRNEMLSDSRFGASMDMLREENEAGAKAVMAFIGTLKDPELKRGFMDAAGGNNTAAAKKLMVQMGSTATDVLDTLKNSNPENMAQQFGKAQDIFRDGAKEYASNFREAAAIMPDTSKLGNWTVLNEIAKRENVSMEKAIEIQEKQKAAVGGLTEDTVKAQQNMERMGQEVWKMGLQAMPYATKAVNAFTKGMVDLMKYINTVLGKAPDNEQDEANWKAMSGGEKVESGLVRGLEKIGDLISHVPGIGGAAKWATDTARTARIQNETSYLASQGRAPTPGGGGGSSSGASSASRASAAPNPTSQKQLADAGLRLKTGDVQGDGKHVDPELIDIAKDIQYTIPGFKQFTGFNDQYHNEKAAASLHTKGIALDFVVDGSPSKRQGAEIVSMMKELGLDYAQDEYNNASAKSTGGHFHGQLKAYDGGVFEGPTSGYNVELHGREAIVPLPDPSSMISVSEEGASKEPLDSAIASASSGSSLGVDQLAGLTQSMMQMMEDKFDEMISQLSTGNAISDKLLRNAMV